MTVRDRIKELRRVKASSLYANPRNWRTHPETQQTAIRGVLEVIGYADALLARELPDGTLELIDGHLRAETTPDQEVPVLIVDLDQDEAHTLLAVLDPLAALAETNKDALASLLREIQTDNEGLAALLDGLAAEQDIDLTGGVEPQTESDESVGGGLGSPVLSYNLVFDTDEQQQAWYGLLRYLKGLYGDLPTHGARIAAWIETLNLPAE